jgi:hypothetical protein
MADLTLVIDDALLRRARMRAISEGTSVNALVRDQLTCYAGVGGGLDAFLEASESLEASSGPSGRTWRRDELHRSDSAEPSVSPARVDRE